MTTLTTDTRLPAQIQTSTPAEVVYELGSDAAVNELRLKFRKEARAAFVPSVQEESPEQYITAEEYPALAEIWDNDADAVYDEM